MTLIALLAFLLIATGATIASLSAFAMLPDGSLGLILGGGTTEAALLSTSANRIAVAVVTCSTAICEVAVIVLLLRMLASARRGSPFVPANVARLRWIALVYVIALACRFILPVLVSPVVADWLRTTSWSYNAGDLGPALVALVLAEVFGEGIRLREDVEATI